MINFNGVNYNSVDDMPPDVRAAYQQFMSTFGDQNQNGVPDLLDKIGQLSHQPVMRGNATIIYNGQTYPNVDALPPEAKAKYEAFQARFDANRNGVPDMLENKLVGTALGAGSGGSTATPGRSASDPAAPAFEPSAPIAPTATPSGPRMSPLNGPSVVSPETGGFNRTLIVIGLVVTAVTLCGFAVLGVLLFLRSG